ncbi:MAG TPA: iron ABC transporter permease [Acidimicrobiia bacterium]|nr:iron ABC transporter permease [Acidimicrobiia bacterium]
MRRWIWPVVSIGLPAIFIGYLFLYPLGRILWISLTGAGFVEVFTTTRFRQAAWFTFWQASASTVLTLVAALPLTWALSRFRFPGKATLRAMVTVPFALPTVVVGAAFLAFTNGGVWSILAAHVFYNLAVVVRTVGGVWGRIDPGIEEAAAVMGASPWRRLRTITLPLLRPALASAAAIVFLFCFTSFGTVLILGRGRLRTIEVEIYQQAVNFLDLPAAGALAVIQIIVVAATLLISARLQRRAAAFTVGSEAGLPRPRSGQRAIIGIVVGATMTLVMIPLVVLLARSFRGGGAGWRNLFNDDGAVAIDPLAAIGNSLLFAVVSALIAVVIGGLAAAALARRGRGSDWFDTILMLPLGTSAVTIGFGFLVALDRPFDLRATLLLIPLAHALVAIPFVVRVTLPLLRSIRRDLREAAAVLGASPTRVWREIDLPIVSRALAVGAGFAAVISLGEFGATSFIARPSTATVPTLIFRLLGRPGGASFATAMALAVVLAALTALVILAVDRLRAGEMGTF